MRRAMVCVMGRWVVAVVALAAMAAPAHAQEDPSEAHARTGAVVSALIPGGTARVTFVLGGIARGTTVSEQIICVTISTAAGRDHGCADTGRAATDALLNTGAVETMFQTESGATVSVNLTLHGYGSYVVERPLTLTLEAASAGLRVNAKAVRNASVSGVVTSSAVGGGTLLPGSSGLLFHGAGAAGESQHPHTTRDSVSTAGVQGMGESFRGSISADGRYVAFESIAPNLALGDTNLGNDVFVRDRLAGVTSRVSVSSRGQQAPWVQQAAISADGRYTAFFSLLDGVAAIYLHDLATRQTTFASGIQAMGPLRISGDGRHIAVVSDGEVFVIDSSGGYARRVFPCDLACGRASGVAISADGLRVAFTSDGAGFVAGDTNGAMDVFVRDLPDGPVTRVSVAADGGEANGSSGPPAITPDGRFVAFTSTASNLVAGDTNGARDVFVRDLVAGTTTLVSIAATGARPGVGSGAPDSPAISADGRTVAFTASTALVPEDGNGVHDVFVRDLVAARTVRASVPAVGADADGASGRPALAADGETLLFESVAANVVLPDLNGGPGRSGSDLYVRFGNWRAL